VDKFLTAIQKIVDLVASTPKFNRNLQFGRVEYRKTTGSFVLYFDTKIHLHPVDYLKLLQRVKKEFETNEIRIEISQKMFAAELEADKEMMESYVRDFLVYKKQSFLPFAANIALKVQKGNIKLLFRDDFAYGLYERSGLAAQVRDYLMKTYLLEYNLSAVLDDTDEGSTLAEYKPLFDVQRELQKNGKNKREIPPLVDSSPVTKGSSAPREEKRRGQRTRITADISGAPIPIAELMPGMDCVIQGRIVYVESVSLRDGQFIKYKFGLYDHTGTAGCWFIEKADAKSKPSAMVVKGTTVKISGSYYYEKYERDNAVSVSNICAVEVRERADMAHQKRVELHLHTTMSAQDAVSDVKSMVARAAAWGHPAIAVTDHGVVQAFPDAAAAAKKNGIKLIYGVEGYLADDEKRIYAPGTPYPFSGEYVVFDIETTGLSPYSCDITEIGAVKVREGIMGETFSTFVRPGSSIPPGIVALTGITDDMVKDAPEPKEALGKFSEFCGDALLVAHNAPFDMGFITTKGEQAGIRFNQQYIDTIALSKAAFPELSKYKLNLVAKHLKIHLDHHRALNDAACTAKVMLACFEVFKKAGIEDLGGLNRYAGQNIKLKNMDMYHIVLLCKNKTGLQNLYRLVSDAHINHYYKRPRMLKSLISKYREGLIVGSACEQGELYRAVVSKKDEAEIRRIASFYDYFEIQPLENNLFMIRKGEVKDAEELKNINRRIYDLGIEMKKPVVATGDVHFLDEDDKLFRQIIFHTLGFSETEQSPLYLRTTDEMLGCFSYLGEDEAYDVVVKNPNQIARETEEIELFQNETAMPIVEGADDEILTSAYETAHRIYGDPLPEIVEARLKRELDSIISNGFGVLYWSAAKLVKKSLSDGYLVGSRGSVGSSLAATMTGITEVNPLPPHYICPKCKHSDFDVDKRSYACGVDLPPAVCPVCKEDYRRDGYDIPFEVFLGINADKVPDIDLNFSGEYQPKAHKYAEELFGADYVFRAGTISSIKDKTAFGYVKKYLDETQKVASAAEINRLVEGVSGVKRTTGQHPGGLVIVPKNREIYEFTAVQKPADSADAQTVTTHFDFNSMHDILIKLDILGHDVPTTIRHLQDLTGMDPLEIPLDDTETMQLFSTLKPLNLSPEQLLGVDVGTLGIPEFGTRFVRQMLKETLPTTMAELVRISGLSHGTDVWVGNAQDLIANGTATLKECICTRDDIMNYLIACGVEKRQSFFIMESVRKGKGLTGEMQSAMEAASVPEWFVDSCKKIKYMFPKAHAVAYVVMAFRIAFCKVHQPKAFYATYFTVHTGEFDCSYVLEGRQGIVANIKKLEAKGQAATANEKNMITMLELANEMYQRGIVFLPVDLEKSDATDFLLEEGGLRMPFLSVPKLGENAARSLAGAREDGDFLSVEDLKSRAKLSSAVIEEMQNMGMLTGFTATNQISIFDL
jgi:DNA polymerase-3 subunit alpha (Gram-positive type)